jgi:uncharacterized protein YjbI with pentapeptide repeats
MKSAFIIKDLTGKSRYRIDPKKQTGEIPHWNEIFDQLSNSPPIGLKNLDLKNLIKESISATGIDFSGTDFSMDSMERSSFIKCTFDKSIFKPTNFHHHADKTDHIKRSIGTLFIDCSFKGCKFYNCDFVMSKFIRCSFENAIFVNCDFRNVTWFDRHQYPKVREWEQIPKLADPFRNSKLKGCKFGHPMANAMGIPVHLMIPISYESVWKHMGHQISSKVPSKYYLGL